MFDFLSRHDWEGGMNAVSGAFCFHHVLVPGTISMLYTIYTYTCRCGSRLRQTPFVS